MIQYLQIHDKISGYGGHPFITLCVRSLHIYMWFFFSFNLFIEDFNIIVGLIDGSGCQEKLQQKDGS